MNGIDPQAWLADVLSRVAAHRGIGSMNRGLATGGLRLRRFWLWRPDPMHVNEVSHVRAVDRVAKELGEDVDSSSTSPSKWSLKTA